MAAMVADLHGIPARSLAPLRDGDRLELVESLCRFRPLTTVRLEAATAQEETKGFFVRQAAVEWHGYDAKSSCAATGWP